MGLLHIRRQPKLERVLCSMGNGLVPMPSSEQARRAQLLHFPARTRVRHVPPEVGAVYGTRVHRHEKRSPCLVRVIPGNRLADTRRSPEERLDKGRGEVHRRLDGRWGGVPHSNLPSVELASEEKRHPVQAPRSGPRASLGPAPRAGGVVRVASPATSAQNHGFRRLALPLRHHAPPGVS